MKLIFEGYLFLSQLQQRRCSGILALVQVGQSIVLQAKASSAQSNGRAVVHFAPTSFALRLLFSSSQGLVV